MSEKLVWNAILNFLNRARKAGNKSDEISRKACEFFTKDDIIKAKEILWSSAHYTNRVSIKKSAEDNINEMLKVLELCEQRNVELPVFVIVEPDEVPICPGEIAAVITRKVTEVCNKLDNFMNKDPPAPSIVPTVTETKPSYAVVLKNLPSDLTKSDLRKDFLQKMCGRECSKIVEVQPRKDNWRVVTASKAICINDYLPTNYCSSQSENKFINACKKLASFVKGVSKRPNARVLITGDFNCDLTDNSSPRTQFLLNYLPSLPNQMLPNRNFHVYLCPVSDF